MSGQIESTAAFDMKDEFARGREKRAVELSEAISARMSPAGALGLPALLDARRLEHGITDGAFRAHCAFDRVRIFQLPVFDTDETLGTSGLIVATDIGKSRQREEAPRGILIGAGLKALDELNSNGIELGHIVTYIRLAPWRIPCDVILGQTKYVISCRSGDIEGSEDLRSELLRGDKKFDLADFGDGEQLVVVDKDGKPRKPSKPWAGEDW